MRLLLVVLPALACLAALFAVSQLSPYHPGLSPVPDHRLWNATQPRGLAAGYFKALQAFIDVTPCEYTVLGWDAAGALYFEALCEGRLQLWTARPEVPESVHQIGQLPANLADTRLSKSTVYPLVRAAGVWPASAELPVRRLYVQSQPLPSPDGAWLAFVSERIYGPQDVLLLSAAPTND